MKDLTRTIVVAVAFVVMSAINIGWYESRTRALNAVPMTGAANPSATYQAASGQVHELQTTFLLVEAGALVVCLALLAVRPRQM